MRASARRPGREPVVGAEVRSWSSGPPSARSGTQISQPLPRAARPGERTRRATRLGTRRPVIVGDPRARALRLEDPDVPVPPCAPSNATACRRVTRRGQAVGLRRHRRLRSRAVRLDDTDRVARADPGRCRTRRGVASVEGPRVAVGAGASGGARGRWSRPSSTYGRCTRGAAWAVASASSDRRGGLGGVSAFGLGVTTCRPGSGA